MYGFGLSGLRAVTPACGRSTPREEVGHALSDNPFPISCAAPRPRAPSSGDVSAHASPLLRSPPAAPPNPLQLHCPCSPTAHLPKSIHQVAPHAPGQHRHRRALRPTAIEVLPPALREQLEGVRWQGLVRLWYLAGTPGTSPLCPLLTRHEAGSSMYGYGDVDGPGFPASGDECV